MVKIATPISELFKKKSYAQKIADNSDCLECRDGSINSALERQEIFHCDMQPIHELTKGDFSYLRRIKEAKPQLRLLTFHMATSCSRPHLKGGIFQTGGKSYTREELQQNAKRNFSAIKKLFGPKIKIAVENNNYYPTQAYRYITEPEFVSEMVYKNKLYFLFDMAHALITCRHTGAKYRDYKHKLPMDRVIQAHISSYGLGKNSLAYDMHICPGDREYEEIVRLLRLPNMRYITVEYYADINGLIASLKTVRKLL